MVKGRPALSPGLWASRGNSKLKSPNVPGKIRAVSHSALLGCYSPMWFGGHLQMLEATCFHQLDTKGDLHRHPSSLTDSNLSYTLPPPASVSWRKVIPPARKSITIHKLQIPGQVTSLLQLYWHFPPLLQQLLMIHFLTSWKTCLITTARAITHPLQPASAMMHILTLRTPRAKIYLSKTAHLEISELSNCKNPLQVSQRDENTARQ